MSGGVGKGARDAGIACPRRANPKSYAYNRRVSCTRYDKRCSITSGTVMADTKLSLIIWFRAMQLMNSTKQCISAFEISLGMVSAQAAAPRDDGRKRSLPVGGASRGGWTPIAEADDVYLGGERNAGRGTAEDPCGCRRRAPSEWPDGRCCHGRCQQNLQR